jgi:hypothetical protein
MRALDICVVANGTDRRADVTDGLSAFDTAS